MDTALEFTKRLAALLDRERAALGEFLVALADFDRRRLWAELGHANLFAFLNRELGLSAGAAHYRKTAAALVQQFPEVVEPIRDGRLCLTSILELAKVMTSDNRADVLPRFFHLSKREAKEISAELCPRAVPSRDVVSAPARGAVATAAVPPRIDLRPSATPAAPPRQLGPDATPCAAPPPAGENDAPHEDRRVGTLGVHPDETRLLRDEAQPLTADLRRLHVTVSRRFLSKLEAARAALSHARPHATTEELLEAGLDLLLAQRAKRHGQVKKPRQVAPNTPDAATAAHASGAIPAHVKREVFQRADGRCEWKLASGARCGSTTRLEYDHVVPRALGGPSTIDNLRLCCRSHNDLAARQVFGDAWMDRFRRRQVTDEAPNAAHLREPPRTP
jgi:5-methylcytosine-specific restriction endonuclease McrA